MFSAMRWNFGFLCTVVGFVAWGQAADPESEVAGSEQAAEVIRNFEGRGALSDGSDPTPPEEALKMFRVRDGLEIELVVAEPDVEQPLFLSFDSRGRMWVVQYRQYQFPEGLKIVEYDNHLRARFDKVPLPPPLGDKGDDVISVWEDTDGDGRYDSKKDVITGLNIATSVETGAGGIWVTNPPYLLFYPDADGDDVPDSDPQVKLSGFGLEDTHSVMNSLEWGPDGWLYGVNGSTTTGKVKDPATGEMVEWQGQMVWRFHPETEKFEIFAEGGGNTFSLEIDAKGHVFSGTNNGNTRGMFYPQGSYGKKSWGKHGPLTNPYAFGYFEHMKHEGDDRRFAQAFCINEGGLLPEEYAGHIIAPNSLHNVVWSSRLERDGSTYKTVDEENVVETDDRWFRPVFGGMGPDGAIYLGDWYDTRLSHVRPVDDWHKTSGRIYRIKPDGVEPKYEAGDLTKASAEELIALFDHPNRQVRRRAVLELGWSGDKSKEADLVALVESNKGQASLEALWALHLLDGLHGDRVVKWLAHPDSDIRRWVARLVGDREKAVLVEEFALVDRCKLESEIQVRVQLASTAKRLDVGLTMVQALCAHAGDLTDPHQPMMIWWALEAHAYKRELIKRWVEDESPEIWENPIFRHILVGRLMKRYAMAGEKEDLFTCAHLVANAPTPVLKGEMLESLQAAYEGVPMPELPDTLAKAFAEYSESLGESGLVMRMRNGDKEAALEAMKAIFDSSLPTGVRTELIRQLGESGDERAVGPLLKVLALDQASALKRVALQALANFDDDKVPNGILGRYGSTLPAEHNVRSTAERVLASRPKWAMMMMDKVDEAVVKDRDVSSDVVQLMMQHNDAELNGRIADHWPGIAAGSGGVDLAAEDKRIKEVLAAGDGDAAAGKVIFSTRCATCHRLFGEGMSIGPDLTPYERGNLDFWIPSIMNPSLELREGFLNYVASMKDGRVLTGLMQDQSPKTVSLRDLAGQVTVLDRAEVEKLEASPISLMPPALLSGLSDGELRDLFAYLMKGVGE